MATVFLADELFNLANAAVQRSDSDPPEAVVALILCVVSLEALLNDLIEIRSEAQLQFLLKGRSSILDKYKALLQDLSGQQPNPKLSQYQDLQLLIHIRNALVHHKPDKWLFRTEIIREDSKEKILEGLESRKIILPRASGGTPIIFVELCNSQVANWAWQTLFNSVDELIGIAPEGKIKNHLTDLKKSVNLDSNETR